MSLSVYEGKKRSTTRKRTALFVALWSEQRTSFQGSVGAWLRSRPVVAPELAGCRDLPTSLYQRDDDDGGQPVLSHRHKFIIPHLTSPVKRADG